MSYDYNTLPEVCDHSITFERYIVDPSDLVTLNYAADTSMNMRGPINGMALVQLYIGGELADIDNPVYGYQILKDTSRVEDPGVNFYKIVFNQEVRLITPLIEVSYNTLQPFCLRCNGIGVLNDFEPSTARTFTKINGNLKLAQKCLKFILTSRCAFYPTFTCRIKDYIGQKYGVTVTDSDIATQITNALNTVKQIQLAQRQIQALDLPEILRDIVSVSAVLDPNDPTLVDVSAVVSSYTGDTMPLNFSLKATS
jgi:hypothetical protein